MAALMAHPQLQGKARLAVLHHHREMGRPCHICGLPIPVITGAANQRHPLGLTVDEIIPRSKGGSSVDVMNTAPAHRFLQRRTVQPGHHPRAA
jgi:hypothetical protein